MQSNVTVLDDSKFYEVGITSLGAKPAKLSTFLNVKTNADRRMNEARQAAVAEPQVEAAPTMPTMTSDLNVTSNEVNVQETPVTVVETPKVEQQVEVK